MYNLVAYTTSTTPYITMPRYHPRTTTLSRNRYPTHYITRTNTLHNANDVCYTIRKAPIFVPTSAKYVCIVKPSQVCKVIA